MHEPLEELKIAAAELMKAYPPEWGHPSKRLVFELACAPGARHGGEVRYSRWPRRMLPATLPGINPGSVLVARPDFFGYEPTAEAEPTKEWYVNFADPHLFVAYGSGLLAQDEMQVAEHPVLGGLREALEARGYVALTVEDGEPTPVLIQGVERRCRIATDVNAAAGRPHGLYGNRFASASDETIRRAVTRIDPPTITNFIAMSALPGGWGYYNAAQIDFLLATAFTGFRSAVEQAAVRTVVHTGFWGCGAFGGNRVLMTMVQIIAAVAAGVDRVVFHTGDAASLRTVADAEERLGELFSLPDRGTQSVVEWLAAARFAWGESDGN